MISLPKVAYLMRGGSPTGDQSLGGTEGEKMRGWSEMNRWPPYLRRGVSVKNVYLVAGELGFYSQSGHTKNFKNTIRSFLARRSAQAEVRRVLCMCYSSCVSLKSVQSFVIENCNGPTI